MKDGQMILSACSPVLTGHCQEPPSIHQSVRPGSAVPVMNQDAAAQHPDLS